MSSESRLGPRLGNVVLFVLVAAVLTRVWVNGAAVAVGSNTFFHLLILCSGLLWLVAAVCGNTWTLRLSWTGVPLALFVITSVVSILAASYKYPAIEHAVALFAFAILWLAVLNLFGPERRHLLFTILFATVFTLSIYAILQRLFIFDYVTKLAQERGLERSKEWTARLLSKEVFATFAYPNSFAGFLALTLPVLAGSLLDSWKAGLRDPLFLALNLGGLVLGIVALALTGSKGGAACAVVGAIAFAGFALTRERPRARTALLAAGVVGVVLAVSLAAAGLLGASKVPGPIRRSLEIRDVYWSAAAKIAKEHPLAGVGLENFREYYLQYKSPTQQETIKVHNDYLQILVELGIPGLLIFLVFCGMVLRTATSPDAPLEPATPVPRERIWLCTAAGASIFIAYGLEHTFDDFGGPALGLILLAVWCAYAALTHRRRTEATRSPQVYARIGTAAGLVAMLSHFLLDFDFYDYGTAMAFFFMSALAAVLAGRDRPFELGRVAAGVGAGLLGVVVLPLLILVLPRFRNAESEKEQGWMEFQKAVDFDLKAEEANRAGKGLEAQNAEASAIAALNRAENHLNLARTLNPLDAEVYLHYSQLNDFAWDRTRRHFVFTESNLLRISMSEGLSLAPLEDAVKNVRPRNPEMYFRLGAMYRKYARFWMEAAEALADNRSRREGIAQAYRQKAVQNMAKAVELYPTRSLGHYWLARVLDEDGSADSLEHYREALRLSDLAKRETIERLELETFQKARAWFRTGDVAAARKLVKEYFIAQVNRPGPTGDVRDAIRQRMAFEDIRPKLPQIMPDDYDEVLKPVIDGVLDDILAERPKP